MCETGLAIVLRQLNTILNVSAMMYLDGLTFKLVVTQTKYSIMSMNIIQSFRSLIKAKVQLPLSRRRGIVADRAPAWSTLDFLSSPGPQFTFCLYHAPTPTHCHSPDAACIFILFIWMQLYFLCLTKSSSPKGRTSEYIKQWPFFQSGTSGKICWSECPKKTKTDNI